MHFQVADQIDAFRAEVRDFLRKNLPADLAMRFQKMRAAPADLLRWQRILNANGWGGPYWPKAHGGTGWTVQERLVFDEECSIAGAPSPDIFAHKLIGPALNHFGTPEQKARHAGGIIRGDSLWCQGFSEPGSGSDLASLRTAAVLQDDHYVVNGQKIWTSYAHQSDWIFMLVRTDPTVKKQAGITMLLADMKSPGITVRPILSIDGRHHLNEVFIEDLRIPVSNRVGEEGDGWKITKFLLNNEHASAAELHVLQGYLRRLKQLATEWGTGTEPLIARPNFALQLARFEAEVNAIAMMVSRVAAMEQAGNLSPEAHALGCMLKVRATELQQSMSLFLVESSGDCGAIAYPTDHGTPPKLAYPFQEVVGGIASEAFFRRASTIYGGSSEVQRGIASSLLFQF
ncbi:acyl-CoA dehydrogenase [Acidovorax sp. 210-6]|jgi:acyl-CoA dehydrogenase|uniref:acyl-CoA dehydrogenase family protein n=1 Tax=Acidovorax sp. 210-6 TaxID=2699468 RepID=UPI001389B7BB|nr:acyl-CoA dehydrogenase family protein [Acidovorax sp. 210-6]NCU66882.1 acyl-CoA dehydrogenase [Acidovorax sp. 210-6]